MFDFDEMIVDAERRAADVGLTVDDLCSRAGIWRSTWQRWKAKDAKNRTTPQFSTWRRVESVLEEEERKREEAAREKTVPAE